MESIRLDKWLWAARFFKTRSISRQAIDGGKIKLNGVRAKAARAIKLGDQVEVQRGFDTYRIVVTSVNDRRGPASEAAKLYRETPESISAREKAAELRKMQHQDTPQRRPDKKQRRMIHRLKSQDIET